MPTTVTPLPPSSLVGPGILLPFQTDVIGPFPPGTTWDIRITDNVEAGGSLLQATLLWTRSADEILLMSSGSAGYTLGTRAVAEGTPIFVRAQLLDSPQGQVVDTGPYATATWSGTQGLGQQILTQPSTVSGGFTETDRTQLNEVAKSTVLNQLVNTLVMEPLTSGPTEGPVDVFLQTLVFAVIVRIANVPPELVAGTPDGNYWLPSLAVVRLFRGADLWLRVPVHTSSKIIPLSFPEAIVGAFSEITKTNWPSNMSLEVDFARGVTGEVFLQHLPLP